MPTTDWQFNRFDRQEIYLAAVNHSASVIAAQR